MQLTLAAWSMGGSGGSGIVYNKIWLTICWVRYGLISADYPIITRFTSNMEIGAIIPDSKVHGANVGPIWGRQDPGGPHVGPMNFAI